MADINWLRSFDQAKSQATEGKPILIDFTAAPM
jgi:hypothetical protein